MTDEERKNLRDYDRQRHAKKKAARLAQEEAARAEILAGTSFEALVKSPSKKDNSKSEKIAFYNTQKQGRERFSSIKPCLVFVLNH